MMINRSRKTRRTHVDIRALIMCIHPCNNSSNFILSLNGDILEVFIITWVD